MRNNLSTFVVFLCVLLSLPSLHVGSTIVKAESQSQSVVSKGLFYVLVNSTIYSGIESNLTQYQTDLVNEGYSVEIHVVSGGTAQEIKSLLASALPNGLVGVLFVGDLPEASYEESSETFPVDLFYMDLNGIWTDSDGDNVFDGHSGDVAPEIFLGRLKASNINGDQVTMINQYLQKVHNYRTGALSLPKQALIYVDDEWASAANGINAALQTVYDETTVVNDPVKTNSTDYKKRITEGEGYEWLHLGCHGNPTGHTFKVPNNVWDGSVNSSDYRAIDPKVMFYTFDSCLIANYDVPNNLASTIVLATSYGLIVVGDTRVGYSIGSMDDFYGPLSQGKSTGSAFEEWFTKHGEEHNPGYHVNYGWTIIGDPTLHVIEPGQHVYDIAVTSVTLTPAVNRVLIADTLTISVVLENQGNRKNASFDVATYYNNTSIGTQTVTDLAVGYSVTLTFTWNTTGVSSGIYTIKAAASTLIGEADIVDNVRIYGPIAVRLPRPMENVVMNSGWETGDNSFWQTSITKMPRSQVSYRVSKSSQMIGEYGFNVRMSTVMRSKPAYTSQSLLNFQSLSSAALDVVTKLDYWIYPNYALYGTPIIPDARWEIILSFSTGNNLHYYSSLNMDPTENSTDKYVLTSLTLGQWNRFLDNSVLTTYSAKFGTPPTGTSVVEIALYVTSKTYADSTVAGNEVTANFDSDQAIGGLHVGRPAQNVDTGLAYRSIQEAINAPQTLNGHTIQVFEGTYGESLVVNKSLTLKGEDPHVTIIDLQNRFGIAIYVDVNDATITGFAVVNSYYGILIESNSSGNTISNNQIVNAVYGIRLQPYSRRNVVSGNVATNNDYGVELCAADGNLVKNNVISNSDYGILLSSQLADAADSNTISGNAISSNTYGLKIVDGYKDIFSGNTIRNNTYGFYLYGRFNSTISSNTISYNTYGIHLNYSDSGTIFKNMILNNNYGVFLYASYNNTILENKISNSGYGAYLYTSSGNTIHHNNFINNSEQVELISSPSNIWTSTNLVGNYWSNYQGADLNSDYTGETLLPHEGIDWYPLMHRWFTCDINGNGIHDPLDNTLWGQTLFGSRLGDPGYNKRSDFNYDGVINAYDLAIWGNEFQLGKVAP